MLAWENASPAILAARAQAPHASYRGNRFVRARAAAQHWMAQAREWRHVRDPKATTSAASALNVAAVHFPFFFVVSAFVPPCFTTSAYSHASRRPSDTCRRVEASGAIVRATVLERAAQPVRLSSRRMRPQREIRCKRIRRALAPAVAIAIPSLTHSTRTSLLGCSRFGYAHMAPPLDRVWSTEGARLMQRRSDRAA